MSKWTPGPWIAIVPDKPCIYNGSDITNFSIHSTSAYHDAGRVDNKTIVSGEFMERIGHEESAANARLIAEAPAMAECLKKCERLAWEIGCYTDDGIHVLHDDERGDLWREISGILERINK